jgi:hypothetical protein
LLQTGTYPERGSTCNQTKNKKKNAVSVSIEIATNAKPVKIAIGFTGVKDYLAGNTERLFRLVRTAHLSVSLLFFDHFSEPQQPQQPQRQLDNFRSKS